MKIIGFTQHRNELSKGNLHNWLRCMDMCEKIYIYDQGSDDGSLEVLRANPKVVLIESPTNDFVNEMVCKQALLDKLLAEQPDTDWVFWLDCDYLLTNNVFQDNYAKFHAMLHDAESNGIDGVIFGHYNLWRSDLYYRTDASYHWAHGPGRISVWKNNGALKFDVRPGLHHPQTPDGIVSTKRYDVDLIHRGFATDYQILTKYNVYKSFGQKGWDLDRLIDESTLAVTKLPDGHLPEWYLPSADMTDPRTKSKLK
jgi:hypothetical protein